jgi:hypothetical protein
MNKKKRKTNNSLHSSPSSFIMKKNLLIALILFLSPCMLSAQVRHNVQHLNITYVESSSGLVPPAMEGGNTELEFADINADGHVDILSIGDHGSPYVNTDEHGIMVWFGDGNGNWSVYQNGDFGYGGIAVGDVNNDGLLDVGYAMHHNYSGNDFGDQLIEVALGDGTGMNWTPWDDGLATNGETWGMFGTDFADFDCDGYLDIGSISFGADAGVHIYHNNGNGTWQQVFGFIGGNSDNLFAFGDINNDGCADFAVSHELGTVYFYTLGVGTFTLMDNNLPGSGSSFRTGTSLGDVDNDGGKDLAFINSAGGVEVWVWNDAENLWDDFSGMLPSTGNYEATQLYDMNVDGYVDVCAFGQGLVSVWLGDGTGNWTLETQINVASTGYFQAFRVGGDIDHNGYPDMVLVDEEGSWPSYQNHLRCYKEASVPENLTVVPIFPRGYEVFEDGSIQLIDWVSAVPDNVQSWVKLEYAIFDTTGSWIPIADSVPNNGRYQWQLNVNGGLLFDCCYIRYTVYTSTESQSAVTPQGFSILGVYGQKEMTRSDPFSLTAYPNPFRESITLNVKLPKKEYLQINVYDAMGKRVKRLYDGVCPAGEQAVVWDGLDRHRHDIPNGIYLVDVHAGNQVNQMKIVHIQ